MGPYPIELRQRVVAAFLAKEGSYREIARRFQVSDHFVRTMVALQRGSGDFAPKPHGGGNYKLGTRGDEVLKQLVADKPDRTLAELRSGLRRSRHLRLSLSGIHRALVRLGVSYKKRRSGPRSGRGPTWWPNAPPSDAERGGVT